MKKVFVLSLVLFVAAACNSKTAVTSSGSQNATTQNTQPSASQSKSTLTDGQDGSLQSFMLAAQTCTPAKATMNAEFLVPFAPGITLYSTENVEIQGYSGQYCHFFSTRKAVIQKLHKEILDKGVQAGALTQAEEDQFIAQFNAQPNPDQQTEDNNIGLTTDCTFTIQNLLTFLNQWQNPDLNGDVHLNVTLTPNSGQSSQEGLYKYCKITLPPTAGKN